MHMADALLSPAVGLAFHAGSAGLLAGAARRAVREPGYDCRLPLMGVLGAFVFAAQMVNFAVPGTGSSGHLGGGLLLAMLLGPSAAFLVIASVLTVQALFFADGGLLALGCNVFNLGFWPALVGLPLQRRLERHLPGGLAFPVSVVLCAMLSLELGALGVALQTDLSGRADLPLRSLLVLMLGIHLPIGLVEGIVTVGVVRFVERLSPGRAASESASGARHAPALRAPALGVLAGLALFAGTALASFASQHPDGLEWALERGLGGASAPVEHATGLSALLGHIQRHMALLPDYGFRGVERRPGLDPGTAVAGLTGGALAALFTLAVGAVLRRARRRREMAAPVPR